MKLGRNPSAFFILFIPLMWVYKTLSLRQRFPIGLREKPQGVSKNHVLFIIENYNT
jgi:hypothetical protein